jgi:hypothetical protein
MFGTYKTTTSIENLVCFHGKKNTMKNEVIYTHPILRYLHIKMNKLFTCDRSEIDYFWLLKNNGSAYEDDVANCNWLQKVFNYSFSHDMSYYYVKPQIDILYVIMSF